MPKWLLPTLSEILALNDPAWTAKGGTQPSELNTLQYSTRRLGLQRVRAEREWSGAIAALSDMLQAAVASAKATAELCSEKQLTCGLVLSGPLPVISHSELVSNISTWSLTANPLQVTAWMPLKLMPAGEKSSVHSDKPTTPALPLLPGDPLATEQFCLVLTPWFSLVMVLGETLTGEPAFMFSFMPEVVQQAWDAIRPRILLMSSNQIDQFDELTQQFAPVAPDYTTVMQFSRLLLEHLPEPLEEISTANVNMAQVQHLALQEQQATDETEIDGLPIVNSSSNEASPDVELLQALAHEIRTPLTTIRTLTRSLLKRADLPPDVIKRLGIIDRECSEQIDRFGLIFRAAELETSPTRQAMMSLTRTSLAQVFQQSIPRWQQQASQRQLTLDVILPQRMPAVVSDPTMLDQALTSLIERFTRSLPAGSHIQVEVMLAGNQLKLQLQSQLESAGHCSAATDAAPAFSESRPLLKSLGQLLMFQPETGSLSLNLAVTKNLFQALGGKLTVKQRPQQGEVMTVFLPLDVSSANVVDA